MSILDTPRTDARRTSWSQVDDGFYVANRGGQFVGYIDTRPGGSFVAFDGTSALLGEFATLTTAQQAVSSSPAPPVRTDRVPELRGMLTATVTGAIALALLAVGAVAGLLV